MQSTSDVALGLTLTLFDTEGGLSESHRHRMPARVEEVPYGTPEHELARAFLAVDWLVRHVLASAIEQHGGRGDELRAFPQIVDSLHALCARQLCTRISAVRAVAEAASDAITELVWADAAIAARSARHHPLAKQVERIARDGSFSDPLDFGYLERTGTAVAIGVIEALSTGVAIDVIAPSFDALWARLRSV